MPTDGTVFPVVTQVLGNFGNIAQFGFVILFILYFFFSLIIIRQVRMMTETVMTEGAPILRFLSVLHSGLILGIIVLYIGLF